MALCSLQLAGSYNFRGPPDKKTANFVRNPVNQKNIPQTGAQVKECKFCALSEISFISFACIHNSYVTIDHFFLVNPQKSDFRDFRDFRDDTK